MPALPPPPTSSAFDRGDSPKPVWTRWLLQLFKRAGGSVGETIPEISAALAATQADVVALGARVDGLEAIVTLPSYLKSALPPASPAGRMIYVTDDVGGATPAFSDGTDWRRTADRAVVS